jgi:hypothetical protein
MKHEEIIEAIKSKRLMADAGAGGGGGAGAGGGAGSGASAGGDGGASSSSGDGGSAGSGDTSTSDSAPTSARGGFFVGYGGYWSPKGSKKKKKKKSKVGSKKDGIYENEKLIAQLEDKKSNLEFALGSARDITKNIKYVDTHVEIVSQLGTLAEEHGLELDDYDERAVFEAKNKLESAIYQLEEVFEDAIRDVSNKIDELEYED